MGVFMHNVSFLEMQSDLNFFLHLIPYHPFIFCNLKYREGPQNTLSVGIYFKEAPVNHLSLNNCMHQLSIIYDYNFFVPKYNN